jgi:hypothetical protein
MKKLTLPPIRLGASSDIPVRIETDALVFAQITGMTQSAALRVTAVAHGIPDSWRAAVMDAKGMTEMNVGWNELRESNLRRITVIDANTVEFPGVSSFGFHAYTSGGALAFYQPKDLSGYTAARMDIKRSVGATALVSLSTGAGTMEIDSANHAVWLRIAPTMLSALPARDYVFDIEMIRANGIDAICSADSTLTVLPEVTTTEP